ncbi:MAG: hypothetical protein J5882_06035, partial [Bacteroidales bacterium]|nr:hypothetical protein [Bacteroidales bacterium]
MKRLDAKLFGAALAVIQLAVLSSCATLNGTSTNSSADDVYGISYTKKQTVTTNTDAQAQSDNNESAYADGNLTAEDNVYVYDDTDTYYDDTDVIVIDDSYAGRIYRFHRPYRGGGYYDVVVSDPWYYNWYWSFGFSYHSPYWSFGWGHPYHYSIWGEPYYGYSWWGYHHHYYSPYYYDGRYHGHYHYSSIDRHYASDYYR